MTEATSKYRLLLAAAVIAAVAYFAGKNGGQLGPQPTPAPPRGPDLVAVFSANPDKAEAKKHAVCFGAICARIADTVEVDAKRGDQRRLQSGIDISAYRSDLRYYTTSGWSFAAKYPALRTAVEEWLDAEAGKDPKQLDEATTRRWVDAFRGLAASAEHAGRAL